MSQDYQERRELIAAAAHSAWYAFTVLGLGQAGEPWATAPDWQKASLHDAVRTWDRVLEARPEVRAAVRTDPAAAARVLAPISHESWSEFKRAEGWTYGPVKDAEAKTHPCLVPYEDLSQAEILKDFVVVHAYLAVRFELERRDLAKLP